MAIAINFPGGKEREGVCKEQDDEKIELRQKHCIIRQESPFQIEMV